MSHINTAVSGGDFLTILGFQKCFRMTAADLLLTPGEGSMSQARQAGREVRAALCSLFSYRTSPATVASELEHNPGGRGRACSAGLLPGRGHRAERKALSDSGRRAGALGAGQLGSSVAPPRPRGSRGFGRWLAALSLCFPFPEVRTHTPPSEAISELQRGQSLQRAPAVPSTWQAPPRAKSYCHTYCDLAAASDKLVSSLWDSPTPDASAHSDPH